MTCNGTKIIRQIKFTLSNSEVAGLNLREDVLISNQLCLYLNPNNYQSITEQDTPQYRQTGRGSIVTKAIPRKGFTATFQYDEANILACIERLANNSYNNNQLITIIDYVRPNIADFITGYTTRTGIIRLPITSSGYIGSSATPEFISGGFTITFMENTLRYV